MWLLQKLDLQGINVPYLTDDTNPCPKGVWMLQLVHSLPSTGYVVMYADDDISINTGYLHQLLSSPMIGHLSPLPLILGSAYTNPRVERTGKNKVSEQEFR